VLEEQKKLNQLKRKRRGKAATRIEANPGSCWWKVSLINEMVIYHIFLKF
jgi:hypothetical protein